MKLLEFKTKKQRFNDWLQEVKKVNFDNNEIHSALFMWELPPTKDGFQGTHCRYNCDLDQLKWFHRILGEKIKEMEFDKYLMEHLHEYLE